jgi:hypothetical protein
MIYRCSHSIGVNIEITDEIATTNVQILLVEYMMRMIISELMEENNRVVGAGKFQSK